MTATAEKPVVFASEQNIAHNRQFWAKYPWPGAGDEWSSPFGGSRTLWACILRPRISAYLPAQAVLEIAPGHGRCTQFLLAECERITLVDLVPECIDACRRRFAGCGGVSYAVNDGSTLPMVPDASIDFAFTWDSLVHVEEEAVCSYIRELGRVLKPGGHAFVHHSNLGAYQSRIPEFDWAKDLHARGKTMTAAAARDTATNAGLHCLSQELIPWGGTRLYIDAISLFRRPSDPGDAASDPVVEEHASWSQELAQARRVARLYPLPGSPATPAPGA